MQAKPDKGKEVADFLRGAHSVVEQEQRTRAWVALQVDESTFGIFDMFPDDARQTHLSGGVGQALDGSGDFGVYATGLPRNSRFEVGLSETVGVRNDGTFIDPAAVRSLDERAREYVALAPCRPSTRSRA
ncbi:hypothetical protein [Kribbella sp. NPDC055071]